MLFTVVDCSVVNERVAPNILNDNEADTVLLSDSVHDSEHAVLEVEVTPYSISSSITQS
eukprot:CAMPEP_0197068026 /NCGR_PEP_ID=MMETSP1384-20130603/183834_1 /TAXON_ID=29189 /ORGANISM="Ammonia sp." /LENGTH=58 /DNA_ID=CAMNT_0042505625 /DNA_START=14 /DNA_END=186 /DNA_ORIENTATION=+